MNNLSLATLAKVALKHIYILIVAGLIAAVLAFSYCSFIATPKYAAKGSLVLTNGSIIKENVKDVTSKVSNSDIVASFQLANTAIDILKTNEIYKELANNSGGKYTYVNLIGCSSIARRGDDSLFIDITFTAKTPEEAQNLVNKFLELAPEYINKFIPGSASAVATMVDRSTKIYPRTTQTIMLAAVLGVFVAYAIVYIIHILHNTIETADDIKLNYAIPLMGEIPDFAHANSKAYSRYNVYAKGGKNNGK